MLAAFVVHVALRLPIVNVPVPVAVSPPSAARTVNVNVPAGVVADVVSVSVKEGNALPPLELHVPELGEKLAVTPAGRPEITLRVPLTVPLPERTGVTVYVALATVPKVRAPVCDPTVTDPNLGASENEVWAEKPEA